ncbi:tetratricopeptide repeat protein [Sporomusa sphaeroides DSM 2875]|uniref:tetratricopeptide repeat protein n=1 Tax=Sporomusa sphaeroides TaxID=47679 RepID=UPI00202E72B6|nr:tetratricopeptide repeat protein [Sporomusa sphaeroides]MCM0758843.1 tetratricopeptide repeat protein [Sporomusa sphaeroides DSM 2875]
MIRKVLLLLTISLCLVISSGNAQVFEDKGYGFFVNVPENWQTESQATQFVFFNNEKKDKVVGIIFFPQYPGARTLAEDYVILMQFCDRFAKGTHATVVEPSKLDKVAGQPALINTLSITRMDGIKTKVLTATFWYNNKLCHIISSAKQDEYDKALPIFKEMLNSLKFNPLTAHDWYVIGTSNQKNKEYDTAIEAFASANKLDPKHAEYVYQLAYTYSEMGKYDQAIVEITKAIELKPKEAFYYHERAYAYVQKKDGQAALNDGNKAIQLDPKNALYYAGRGNAYALLGQYTEAIKDFQKQAKLKGESSETCFNLGQCYELLGNKEKALTYYKKTKAYSDIPANITAKVSSRINNDWESFKEWI